MSDNRKEVLVWERREYGKPRELKNYAAPYYFYVEDPKGTYTDILGKSLTLKKFFDPKEFRDSRDSHKNRGITLYESDISPENKVLSQYYSNTAPPKSHITFFDIEVDYDKTRGFSDIDNPYAPVSSIALHHYWSGKSIVLVVPPPNLTGITMDDIAADIKQSAHVILCMNEKELLRRFMDEIDDSDIISGWNSAYFDVPYIYERIKMVIGESLADKLSFPMARKPKYREVESRGVVKKVLDIYGRESVDYMEIFRKFEVVEKPSYSLEAISEEKLPELPKLHYEGTLYDLYRDNFDEFLRYNIRDCDVLKGFEDKLGYMQLAIHMSHAASGVISNILGTIKLAELAIINFCHAKLDRKVRDAAEVDEDSNNGKFTGALVLSPQVGLHKWVGSVDIASLYPSAIRSGNYSPDTVVGQFFETHLAFSAIKNQSSQQLFFRYENGEVENRTASEWWDVILERNWNISGYGTVFAMDKQGFIPAILTEWFADRKKYKKEKSENLKKMKEAIAAGAKSNSPEVLEFKERAAYCDRVQYIKKIQLNSMYGALGNKYFKFFDVRLAESTTRTGQEILMHMVRKAAEALDGTYAYPSESTIYSDTDSCYFLTHATDKKSAIGVAKYVHKLVNASFPEFMRQTFNCLNGYDNLISAEIDVIASSAIFIKKKHYLMHVVSQEGEDKDEMKIMGIQLKKTTIPKQISTKLVNIIETYLKGKPWAEVSKDIVEFKDMLLQSDISAIGLPKGVKKVEEYTERLNAKESGLTVPGHVAASIFYNKCLEAYGDVDSFKITSGMKIRTYYLTKKFGKFKSIAIPTDLKTIPEWFTIHFEPLVDREAQLLRLMDAPLQNIFDAIDLVVPSHMTILYDELVEY